MVELLATFVILTIALILLIAFRPELTTSQGGKILAFVVLLVLPVASMRAGFSLHFEATKTVSFCLSCHAGSQAFDQLHEYDLTGMATGEISCTSCHRLAHGK